MRGDRGASVPVGTDDFNNRIIEEYRANEGRVGGPLASSCLRKFGTKTGRQIPLFVLTRDDRGDPSGTHA